MIDGLGPYGPGSDDYDLSEIYRKPIKDEHGHSDRLPAYAINPWMMSAADELCGKDGLYQSRAELVRDAIYHRLKYWQGNSPELCGPAMTMLSFQARTDRLKWLEQQRVDLVAKLLEIWEYNRQKNVKESVVLGMSKEVYEMFVTNGWDTEPLLRAVPARYHDELM